MEEWRPIADFPDYEVSNQGNVRSNKSGNWNMLKACNDGNKGGDYLVVSLLSYNDKRITKRVHRLVAEAFIPNLENKKDVDHLDINRQNNKVENLRWATRSENMLNTRDRTAHRNIQRTPNGNYHVQIWRNRIIVYDKTFDTEAEAIQGRDAFLILT
jgi:hypothetical protein